MREIDIMDVGGFRVGHAQNHEAATGLTVILCDALSPAGLDVRGGGPASRESQILNPLMAAQGIHAVLLSGGSAFGLDAAGGVMKYLEQQGVGFAVGPIRVPLVSQSCLFDLGVGRMDVRPDAAMAYCACENASYVSPTQGNVGAGTGCTVGKLFGPERAMKAGFGAYAVETGNLKVGAMVAVNALGDVIAPDGTPIAGLLNAEKTAIFGSRDAMCSTLDRPNPMANTTLGVVVTNVKLTKAQLCKVAGMTHNGYARAICPVHTSGDGDSIYALSVGQASGSPDAVGVMAAYAMERAIVRAAKASKPAYGYHAYADLFSGKER